MSNDHDDSILFIGFSALFNSLSLSLSRFSFTVIQRPRLQDRLHPRLSLDICGREDHLGHPQHLLPEEDPTQDLGKEIKTEQGRKKGIPVEDLQKPTNQQQHTVLSSFFERKTHIRWQFP